jgi:sec-independent protein translocase protein TatA
MPNIGPLEIILVLAIALIVLGPKRLPDAGRSVGRSLREFKSGMSGSGEKDAVEADETTAPAEKPPPPA